MNWLCNSPFLQWLIPIFRLPEPSLRQIGRREKWGSEEALTRKNSLFYPSLGLTWANDFSKSIFSSTTAQIAFFPRKKEGRNVKGFLNSHGKALKFLESTLCVCGGQNSLLLSEINSSLFATTFSPTWRFLQLFFSRLIFQDFQLSLGFSSFFLDFKGKK